MERESEETLVHAFTGPPPGTVLLEKYRVDWTLGMGGFGLVLRAQHLTLDEPVAIKILRDDKDTDHENVERFLREAQAVVRLKSEHVTRIWDVGRLPNNAPYMVMELLDGVDLGQLLETRGHLPVALAVDFMLQACDALAEAHSIGIVHRDIKPTNIFLARRRDGSEIIKVLDFGISKSLASSADLSLTQSASLLGTPMYMSPEQMRSARSVDPRSDVWSVGCVLFELVEGAIPFPADSFAELCVVVATEPPRPMVHALALEAVLHRCLAKEPGDRFASLGELAAALAPFASPDAARTYVARIQRTLANAAAPRPAAPRRARSRLETDAMTLRKNPSNRPLVIALSAIVVAICGLVLALVLRKDPTPTAQAPPEPPPAVVAPPPQAEPPAIAPPAPPIVEQPVVEPPPVVAKPKPQVSAPKPPVVVAPKPPVVAAPPKPHCDPYKTKGGC